MDAVFFAWRTTMNAAHLRSLDAFSPTPTAHQVRGWRFALISPFGWLIRAWTASLHFEISPEAHAVLTRGDTPVAFVLWHNRLFLVSEVHRRYRGGRHVYGLVSSSKDGAWLDAFFRITGLRTVRGSSSRGAREAVTALIDRLREGHDIGITPDGPRGPRYEMKAGAMVVTRRAHAPIFLLGAAFESAWQLPSWDRFFIPRPFSRVRIYCREISPDTLRNRDEALVDLQAQLMELSPDLPESIAVY